MIYLDMDGVLVDLQAGILRKFGRHRGMVAAEHLANWSMWEFLAESEEVFWDYIHEGHAPALFWANLEPTPWCGRLVEAAGDFTILTTPAPCGWGRPSCLGKEFWLRAHGLDWSNATIRVARPVCFTPTGKEGYAAPDTLLIDDDPRNVKAFTAAGGRAWLLAQPYNVGGSNRKSPDEIIKRLEDME